MALPPPRSRLIQTEPHHTIHSNADHVDGPYAPARHVHSPGGVVNPGGTGAAISVQEEGATQGNINILNFVGDSITVTVADVTATITVLSSGFLSVAKWGRG